MIYKFNGGSGAILCSKCRAMIYRGEGIPQYIRDAIKNGDVYDLPDLLCDKCKEKKDDNSN